MVFYSFYTNWTKEPEDLVYRTEDGWSELQVNLKLFNTQRDAEKDFWSLLWDNEDFRINEYVDTEKGKKKQYPQKEKEDTVDTSHLYRVPEDFNIELNKVYNMDAITFMKTLPKAFIDYTFTSPPYNVGKRISFGENNSIYKDDTDMYAMYDDEQDDETS